MTDPSMNEHSMGQIMDLIANLFGSRCEVVLHDLDKPYDHTLVDIRNGHITGRTIGDCGSNLGLEVIRGTVKNGDKFNYITHTRDGKVLRSATVYLRNPEGKVKFALCANLDITESLKFETYLQELNQYQVGDTTTDEVFVNNVGELLDHFLQKGQEHVGKPMEEMNKEDKLALLEFLDLKGAFLINKAGQRVCEALRISKFTLYNYLDQIHHANGESDQGNKTDLPAK